MQRRRKYKNALFICIFSLPSFPSSLLLHPFSSSRAFSPFFVYYYFYCCFCCFYCSCFCCVLSNQNRLNEFAEFAFCGQVLGSLQRLPPLPASGAHRVMQSLGVFPLFLFHCIFLYFLCRLFPLYWYVVGLDRQWGSTLLTVSRSGNSLTLFFFLTRFMFRFQCVAIVYGTNVKRKILFLLKDID